MTSSTIGPSNPEKILIGEPVTKPDGGLISLYKEDGGIILEVDGGSFRYNDNELGDLGDGNWQAGVGRVAASAYKTYADKKSLAGDVRPLNDSLPSL